VQAYEQKEAVIGAERMRELERAIMLYMIDSKWVDHLQAMDILREGIGLRAYGQLDPLVEYKRESYLMFNDLLMSVGEDFVRVPVPGADTCRELLGGRGVWRRE